MMIFLCRASKCQERDCVDFDWVTVYGKTTMPVKRRRIIDETTRSVQNTGAYIDITWCTPSAPKTCFKIWQMVGGGGGVGTQNFSGANCAAHIGTTLAWISILWKYLGAMPPTSPPTVHFMHTLASDNWRSRGGRGGGGLECHKTGSSVVSNPFLSKLVWQTSVYHHHFASNLSALFMCASHSPSPPTTPLPPSMKIPTPRCRLLTLFLPPWWNKAEINNI